MVKTWFSDFMNLSMKLFRGRDHSFAMMTICCNNKTAKWKKACQIFDPCICKHSYRPNRSNYHSNHDKAWNDKTTITVSVLVIKIVIIFSAIIFQVTNHFKMECWFPPLQHLHDDVKVLSMVKENFIRFVEDLKF